MASITILALILLVIVCVSPRYAVRIYQTPRLTALAFSIPACFYLWQKAGGPVQVDPLISTLAAGVVTVLFLSTVLSERSDLAFPQFVKLAGAIFIGLIAAPVVNPDHLFPALVYAAALCSVLSLLQRLAWIKGFDKEIHHGFGGFLGNTNFLGPYLSINAFIALSLAEDDFRFFFYAGIIVAGLVVAKCRAAFAGFVGGLFAFIFLADKLFFVWFALVGLVCLAFGYATRHYRPMKITGNLRLEMWRNSRRFLTWRVLLIGLGPDQYGSRFERARFMSNDDEPPHRACLLHNDLIQQIFDAGAVYSALVLAIILLSIGRAFSLGDPFLGAILVAWMVNSLGFHPTHLVLSNLTMWIVVGRINFAPGFCFAAMPTGIVPFVTIALLFVAASTWGRVFLSEFFTRRAMAEKGDLEKRFRFMRLADKANPSNTMAAGVHFSEIIARDKWAGYVKAAQIVARNDGRNDPAQIYFIHGFAAFQMAALDIARLSFETALYYNPGHEASRNYLERIGKICSKK